MYDIDKTIKHFESLQKRYTTAHQGNPCKRVADALEALYRYRDCVVDVNVKLLHSPVANNETSAKTESSGVIYTHIL